MNARKHLTTAALVLGAAGALGLLYFDRGKFTTGEAKQREGQLIASWRRGEVGEVHVTQGNASFLLRKVDGDFRLKTPYDELADVAAVERLLSAFDYARPLRNVSEGVDLGFSPPRATARVNMGKAVATVELGKSAPIPEGAAYARVDGASPVVVSRDFVETLLRPVDAYRDKRISPYLSNALTRLEISGASGSLLLTREGDLPFRLPRFQNARPRRERLDRVWVALSDLRAESFPDLEASNRELAATGLPLTVRLSPKLPKDAPAELILGGVCGKSEERGVLVVRKAPVPVAACVPAHLAVDLAASDASMLDRGITTLRVDEVSEISFRAGGASLDWARSGATFRQRSPEDMMLDEQQSERIRTYLETLFRDESSVFDSGAADTSGDLVEISLRRGDNREERVTVRGKHLQRSEDHATLRVGARLRDLLAARAMAKDRVTPWDARPDAADVFRIAIACGDSRDGAERKQAGFVRAPASRGAEPFEEGSAHKLIAAFLDLRLDSRAVWVAAQGDGTYGFSESPCSVTVEWKERMAALPKPGEAKTRFHTLELGATVGDRVYARFTGTAGVFTVPATLRALIAGGFRKAP